MAKFCTQCGRRLEEGEVCNCKQQAVPQAAPQPEVQQETAAPQQAPQPEVQQETAAPQQAPQPEVQQQVAPKEPNPMVLWLKGLFWEFLNLILKPVTEGKKVIVEANVLHAVTYIGLQGILSGIFGMLVGAKCFSAVKGLVDLVGGYTYAYGVGDTVLKMLSMPYGRIFFVTFLVSVIMSCVLAGFFMLGNMILKRKVSYLQMLSAVAIRSALLIPGIVVAMILVPISMMVGSFWFVMIGIWGIIVMVVAMTSSLQEEQKNLFVLIASGAIVLFVIIMALLVSKLWTCYLPDLVRTALNTVEGFISDPYQLMNLLGNYF